MKDESEDFEWTDAHEKVFEFVDQNESAESGVGVGVVTLEMNLNGYPDFEAIEILEDAFFDLVENGFFELGEDNLARVSRYP